MAAGFEACPSTRPPSEAARSRRASPNAAADATSRAFEACPVCGSALPVERLERHVLWCLDRSVSGRGATTSAAAAHGPATEGRGKEKRQPAPRDAEAVEGAPPAKRGTLLALFERRDGPAPVLDAAPPPPPPPLFQPPAGLAPPVRVRCSFDDVVDLTGEPGDVPCSAGTQLTQSQGLHLATALVRVVGRTVRECAAWPASGTPVILEREPENPEDPHAVRVVLAPCTAPAEGAGSRMLGYVKRAAAAQLSHILLSASHRAGVSVAAVAEACAPGDKVEEGITAITLTATARFTDVESAQAWSRFVAAANASMETSEMLLVSRTLDVVASVLEHDDHLLSSEEAVALAKLPPCSRDEQSLLVKLYSRKPTHFFVDALPYPGAKAAVDGLLTVGLLREFDGDACDVLPELNVTQLEALIRALGRTAPRGAKGELVRSASAIPGVLRKTVEMYGRVVRVDEAFDSGLRHACTASFLTPSRNLRELIIGDVTETRYPSYVIDRAASVFDSRQGMLDFLAAREKEAELDAILEQRGQSYEERAVAMLDRTLEALRSTRAERDAARLFPQYQASWVYTRMVTHIISLLERRQEYTRAGALFEELLSQPDCPDYRGRWLDRWSIDLSHLGRDADALRVCEAGIDDPWVRNGDRDSLLRRGAKLVRKLARNKRLPQSCPEPTVVAICGRSLNSESGRKLRFASDEHAGGSVEQYVLDHFANGGDDSGDGAAGWDGVHTENSIWGTLFGLLMAPCIFLPVPGVFLHPYQTAPMDINDCSFTALRKDAIEQRLFEIASGDVGALIQQTYNVRHGERVIGVSWKLVDDVMGLERLKVAASCIGGPALARICALLCEDRAAWMGGAPDLLLWRTEPRLEAFSCEVKSVNDTLSAQQRIWLAGLNSAGLRAVVARVA